MNSLRFESTLQQKYIYGSSWRIIIIFYYSRLHLEIPTRGNPYLEKWLSQKPDDWYGCYFKPYFVAQRYDLFPSLYSGRICQKIWLYKLETYSIDFVKRFYWYSSKWSACQLIVSAFSALSNRVVIMVAKGQ